MWAAAAGFGFCLHAPKRFCVGRVEMALRDAVVVEAKALCAREWLEKPEGAA